MQRYESVYSLWATAEYCISTNNPLGAIRSLLAAIQFTEHSQLLQVKTRVRLAQVLLEHTFELELAEEHLQKAVFIFFCFLFFYFYFSKRN